MKTIAMYLPQFHRVPENDEWWGDGFTEWTSAKAAKPLFEGHYQPHVPQNEKYYDLLKKETMIWQADLMHQYDVDGMCFYHYWFKDGRRILEKPAENLLKWKDINMPFCFCWANESWAMSWSNVKSANVWSEIHEKKETDKALLLEQDYGSEENWKEHFNYLLPFFKDERYIRINNKPVFLIYKSDLMYCMGDMIECWRKWAVEAGLEGLFFIGAFRKANKETVLDARLRHEPPRSFAQFREVLRDGKVLKIDYEKICETIINEPKSDTIEYYSVFPGYDDTPRRGTKGTVIENSTPEKFQIFLSKIMAKSEVEGKEICFINAWNEWGEGMHLEPDNKYGLGFLQAVKESKSNYKNYIDEISNKKNDEYIYMYRGEKFEKYMNLLDIWMNLREEGVQLNTFFEKNNFKNIGIYGFGILGRHLITELNEKSTKIKFVIDEKKDKITCDYPIYSPKDNLPDCDIIVVTAVYYFDEIKAELSKKGKIISLEEVLRYFC